MKKLIIAIALFIILLVIDHYAHEAVYDALVRLILVILFTHFLTDRK